MNQEKQLHFSIDGKWLADFSRTRVEEGDYQHALRILDCLEGMGMDDKIAILKGEKDLEGVNSLNLVESSAELKSEVEKFYQYKYGSLLRFENRYYEPYMIVNSWCLDDLPENNSHFSPFAHKLTKNFESHLFDEMDNMFGGNRLGNYPHSRSLHYADNPRDDLAYTFNLADYKELKPRMYDGVILFKEVKEQIPFWVDSYIKKNPKEAIYCAIKNHRYFSIGGAEITYETKGTLSPMKIDNPYVAGESYMRLDSEEDETRAIVDLQKRIQDYADNDKIYGWKHFQDEEGHTIKVPGRAFMHFALNRCSSSVGRGFNDREIPLPEYVPISASGLKMGGDDPYHTDSWLGAGLELRGAYDHDSWQYKLFMDAVWKMQYAEYDMQFNIIAKGKNTIVEGFTVNTENYSSVPKGQRILVIPNLSVDFEQAFFACDHVICETGGKLAHLAILAREFDKSIIRMENATLQFIRKKPIKIDFINGKLEYNTEYTEQKKLKP